MRLTLTFWHVVRLGGVLCVPLLALYVWTLPPTIITAYGGSDGGELATAIWAGGVPHPPGAPTYLLAGRVLLLLPWGEVAWRLSVLSALATAGTATLLAAGLLHVPCDLPPFVCWSVALSAGWLYGVDSAVWQQAIIVEQYALAVAMLALSAWLWQRWQSNQQLRTIAALGLVFGLGAGVHPLVLVALSGWIAVGLVRRRMPALGPLLLFSAMAALGLSVFGVLVWRGAREPQHSWGDWTTFDGAWAHITAREYRDLMGAVPLRSMIGRIGWALRDLVGGLSWPVSGLALIGLVRAGARLRMWRWWSLGVAGSVLAWAISYAGTDSTVYLLPLHWLGAGWAGVGGLVLAQRWPTTQRVMIVVPLLIALLMLHRVDAVSLHGDTSTRDRAIAHLNRLAPDSVLWTADDSVTFPLWYVQHVGGMRRDVRVVDARLWNHRWYRARFGCADDADVLCVQR